MATANKKKTPKRRRWLLPKFLMLLGIVILSGILVALFVMEQELNRIGFFTRVKVPSFQLPPPLQKDSPEPTSPTPLSTPPPDQSPQPQALTPQAPQVAGQLVPPQATEDLSHDDRKRLDDLTTSRRTEDLSRDDRKQLDEVLRSR